MHLADAFEILRGLRREWRWASTGLGLGATRELALLAATNMLVGAGN